MSYVLECRVLTGGRGSLTAFRDVDLAVEAGRIHALLGPNGAGKTSFLLTVAGLLPAHRGNIVVDGHELRTGRATAASRAGIALVPDSRELFSTLSVEENLLVARRRAGPPPRSMLEVFPALEQRWSVRAGSLSGGEQQMLAMARALLQRPRVLLVDELSMGLAPPVVERLFAAVRQIATEHGCTVVFVEQYVGLALQAADSASVLNRGAIVLAGSAAEIASQPEQLERAYLGASGPLGEGANLAAPTDPASGSVCGDEVGPTP
jgi:branched-chain amino acid transport system ATP-binding protein